MYDYDRVYKLKGKEERLWTRGEQNTYIHTHTYTYRERERGTHVHKKAKEKRHLAKWRVFNACVWNYWGGTIKMDNSSSSCSSLWWRKQFF